MDDAAHMALALDLAEKGAGFTSPNPMVGAVVVKNGVVVGKGYHRAAGTPHAEVNALAEAGTAARGATLYVTLEPCNHTGRTPPCTEAVLAAGIARVVSAMEDPNPKVAGGGHAFLSARGVDVTCGLLEARARKLNESFIKFVTTGLPFVTLKCAMTLDGRIATRTGDSKWITGEESRRFVHELRHRTDGILVGIGTVLADDPELTARIEGGKNPRRIILDTKLSIPETAKVLRPMADSDTLCVVGPDAPIEKKQRLMAQGGQVLLVGLKDGKISWEELLPRLGAMNITSLLVEGGGAVLASALAEKIADKVLFFYGPKILGGGVCAFRGEGPDLLSDAALVKDITVHRFGEDVLVEGYLGCSQGL